MSSKKPSKTWDAIASGQRLRTFLIQVYISYHRELRSGYSAREVASASNLVENGLNTIAELQGGRIHSWDDYGGLFLFLAEEGDGFEDGCLAAVQMLGMMPAINEDVRLSADVAYPVEVCITCDTGLVAFARDPSEATGPVIDALIENRRKLGVKNCVTITERVYRQLSRSSKAQFTSLSYSSELEVDLHRTPPFQDEPDRDGPPARRDPDVGDVPWPGPVDYKSHKVRDKPTGRSPQSLADRARAWLKAAAILACVFLAGLVVGWALLPARTPAPVVLAAPEVHPNSAWGEPFSTPEWIAWRKHAHKTLSGAEVNEKLLGEALRDIPSAPLSSPAGLLRRDQEIADVLLKYDDVRSILSRRLGIDEHFLGTGLSNPVDSHDYGKATVHEYLIPNRRDNVAQVWMRRLKSFPEDLDRTVGELIEDAAGTDLDRQGLRKSIVSLAKAKNWGTGLQPVIRFARLNEERYSGKLGPDNRVRVFASDLAEIWDLKIKDAAALSGYPFHSGDTFFVWVFVPAYPTEAIPATWGNVLKNLSLWLKPNEDKAS